MKIIVDTLVWNSDYATTARIPGPVVPDRVYYTVHTVRPDKSVESSLFYFEEPLTDEDRTEIAEIECEKWVERTAGGG